MRILLDECIPRKLKQHFSGLEIKTVSEMGWSSIKNGKLLTLAVENRFDIFLTIDKNLRYQQNMDKYPISIVVMDVLRSKISLMQLLIPQLMAMVDKIEKHKIYEIS